VRTAAGRLASHPPRIALVPTRPGRRATACAAGHGGRQDRPPVRFADGIRTAHTEGVTRFLDIGPDGTSAAMIEDGLD
ncbi:hypothetical protein, partial [Streptomyces prasinus]